MLSGSACRSYTETTTLAFLGFPLLLCLSLVYSVNLGDNFNLLPKLIQGAIFFLGLVAAVYMANFVVEENYRVLAIVVLGLVLLPLAWNNLWLLEGLIIPCSMLAGGIAYAKGFTPFHVVSMAFLSLFFLKNFNSLRFVSLKWTPPFFMVLTLFFVASLLLFHMVDLRFGITRPTGIGGLKLGLSGFLLFCLFLKIIFFGVDARALKFVPFLSLGVAFFLLFLELGARYVPALHYPLRSIYDTNWEFMYSDTFQKFQERFFRIQTLREVGLFFLFVGISFFSRKRFLGFRSLFCMFLLLLGLACLVGSGYRAFTAIGLIIGLLGIVLHFRILSVYPIALVGLILAGVIAYQGSAYELPLQAQRALKWLPGDWDPRVTQEESGADWRLKLWNAYLAQIRPSVFWIGQGQEIDPGITEASSVFLVMSNEESSLQMFVDMKALHSGLLTTMDIIGIPGVLILATWMLYGFFKGIYGLIRTDFSWPTLIWFFLFFAWNWPGFWYTGSFPNSFVQLFLSTILLSYVCDLPHGKGGQTQMPASGPFPHPPHDDT